MTAPASMEVSGGVEESKTATEPKPSAPTNVNAAMEEEESLPDPLKEALEAAEELAQSHPSKAITAFHAIVNTPDREDDAAQRLKEEAIYRLAKLHADAHQFQEVMLLLKTSDVFFAQIPKAKTAKIVRTIIDIVTKIPDSVDLQVDLCREVVAWCIAQKRTFLRQRIESRLATLLYARADYSGALALISKLLRELKKFDDKQLLVETHLVEARIDHALRNLPKAKAALTAARTAGNSIYVVPAMQAELDQMSGVLHCEEGDYKTAHSYFLEAFEAFDSLSDLRAPKCLEYMMLCLVLQGTPQDVSAVTSKHGLKYAGDGMNALIAIAAAAKERSLEAFDAARKTYGGVLAQDLLLTHHVHIVYEQLLESNLLKIIEPFSCVEIEHVATLINLPQKSVERKLSQMILDDKLYGTLDQGKGQLLVYERSTLDKTFSHGLELVGNLGMVVDSLFRRAQKMVHAGHAREGGGGGGEGAVSSA
ncbi:26s proteasome non-atpase regulatory subunit 11 [Nannochloropsis gaditana]|uniref:26s proteasome non-atpase regulatory subunit 11 n=1 Tax=Nannochloropsis gaditana TaxID=72520 RepID=W7U2B3_9STRA|nr:26s proteasome non-atpase regulatory subunit 11 [Nannochloropsis gaditana]